MFQKNNELTPAQINWFSEEAVNYKFKQDPFYSNGFVPTVKQLIDRILTGD